MARIRYRVRPRKKITPKKGSEENISNKQYLYHKSGEKKAELVHILKNGDCPRCWEKKENHFTDGVKVYKKINL